MHSRIRCGSNYREIIGLPLESSTRQLRNWDVQGNGIERKWRSDSRWIRNERELKSRNSDNKECEDGRGVARENKPLVTIEVCREPTRANGEWLDERVVKRSPTLWITSKSEGYREQIVEANATFPPFKLPRSFTRNRDILPPRFSLIVSILTFDLLPSPD